MDPQGDLAPWQPRGRIDLASFGAIVLSPAFDRDSTVLALSLAGLHLSRDGGDSWVRVDPDVIGALPTAVAFDRADADRVVVSSVDRVVLGDLRHDSWGSSGSVAASVTALAMHDGLIVAAGGPHGTVWQGRWHEGTLSRGSELGSPVDVLRSSVDGSRLWAVSDHRLLGSDDAGLSWQRVPIDDAIVDIDEGDGGSFAAGLEGRLWHSPSGDDWEAWGFVDVAPVSAIAATATSHVYAVGNDGVCRSDVGRGTGGDGPLVGLSVAALDRIVFVGTAGDGLWRSRDGGRAWTPLHVPDATLISHVAAAASGRLLGTTLDQQAVISDDGGISWSKPDSPRPTRPTAWAMSPTGSLACIDGDAVHHEEFDPVPLPDPNVRLIALAAHGADLRTIVASDSSLWTAEERGSSWEAEAFEPTEDRVIDAVYAGGDAVRAIGAATRDAAGATLWLRIGERAWSQIGRWASTVASMAMTASGACYAAIGEDLFRPARMGTGIHVQEQPGLGPILAVSVWPSDDQAVAVHAPGVLGASIDGGLRWSGIEMAPGPATTAIALYRGPNGFEVLAFRSGGSIVSIDLAHVVDGAAGVQ